MAGWDDFIASYCVHLFIVGFVQTGARRGRRGAGRSREDRPEVEAPYRGIQGRLKGSLSVSQVVCSNDAARSLDVCCQCLSDQFLIKHSPNPIALEPFTGQCRSWSLANCFYIAASNEQERGQHTPGENTAAALKALPELLCLRTKQQARSWPHP